MNYSAADYGGMSDGNRMTALSLLIEPRGHAVYQICDRFSGMGASGWVR